MRGWEADERPEPRSLGLLPSGPDPVGEWLVHRQPPDPISAASCKKARQAPDRSGSSRRQELPPQAGRVTVVPAAEPFMSPRPDLGPKPRLGYTASSIERAAERRADAAALAVLENDSG